MKQVLASAIAMMAAWPASAQSPGDTWETLAPVPGVTPSGCLVAVDGESLYAVVADAANNNNSRGFYRYSISGNFWEVKRTLPFQNVGHTAAMARIASSPRLYLMSQAFGRGFHRYDPETDEWIELNEPGDLFPVYVEGGFTMTAAGDSLYATDGQGDADWDDDQQDFYRYTPGGSWTELPSLPQGRWSSQASLTHDGGDFIYATTGGDYDGINHAWRYSISAQTWEELPSIPGLPWVTRGGSGVAVGPAGSIFALPGDSRDAYRLDLMTSSWMPLAPAPAAITYGGAMTWPGAGTFLYVARGTLSNGGLTDFWRYVAVATPEPTPTPTTTPLPPPKDHDGDGGGCGGSAAGSIGPWVAGAALLLVAGRRRAVLLAFLVIPVLPAAAQDYVMPPGLAVNIEPGLLQDSTALPGTLQTFQVAVKGLPLSNACIFTVDFDPAVLTFMTFQPGAFDITTTYDPYGQMPFGHLTFLLADGEGISGDAPLLNLLFVVAGVGSTELTLGGEEGASDPVFSDGVVAYMASSTQDGFFMNELLPPPTGLLQAASAGGAAEPGGYADPDGVVSFRVEMEEAGGITNFGVEIKPVGTDFDDTGLIWVNIEHPPAATIEVTSEELPAGAYKWRARYNVGLLRSEWAEFDDGSTADFSSNPPAIAAPASSGGGSGGSCGAAAGGGWIALLLPLIVAAVTGRGRGRSGSRGR